MSDDGPKGLHARLEFSFEGSRVACRRAVEEALGLPFVETRSDDSGRNYVRAVAMGLVMHLGLPDDQHKGSFSMLSCAEPRRLAQGFADISFHFVAVFAAIPGMRDVSEIV